MLYDGAPIGAIPAVRRLVPSAELREDRGAIGVEPIGVELRSTSEPAAQATRESVRIREHALADVMGRNQLRVGIDRRPHPRVADAGGICRLHAMPALEDVHPLLVRFD